MLMRSAKNFDRKKFSFQCIEMNTDAKASVMFPIREKTDALTINE